jgi:hypothetical protein
MSKTKINLTATFRDMVSGEVATYTTDKHDYMSIRTLTARAGKNQFSVSKAGSVITVKKL